MNRLAGFADRLIGAMNHEAGCDVTLTFDKAPPAPMASKN